MKKYCKLFFVFVGVMCFNMSLFALKPVTIEGLAPFAKGKEVRFYVYDDLLSQNRVFVLSAEVDAEGNFRAQIPVNETTLLTVGVNTTYGSFFIEPEKSYQIQLSTDEERLEMLNSQMLGNELRIYIQNSDRNELNWKINLFDLYYNYFLYNHGEAIAFGVLSVPVYDSLLYELTSLFPLGTDTTEYYAVYVKYRIASLDKMFYAKSSQRVFEKYLIGRDIYYNNLAYMDFINEFFADYLNYGTRYISVSMLKQIINTENNYFKLFNELGKDPLLVNEALREMILIKSLGDLLKSTEYNHQNILSMLKNIAATSKFPEHKKMAEDKLTNLTQVALGTQSKEAAFKDKNGNIVKLSDFKGKYVYVHFFTTYCQDCIREMLIVKDIQEKYADQGLEVISVMMDFDSALLPPFIEDYPDFDWTIVHFNDMDFIDNYQVYGLPLGMLIDKAGKIISYPTPLSSDGLLMLLYPVFSEQNKDK